MNINLKIQTINLFILFIIFLKLLNYFMRAGRVHSVEQLATG